MPTSKKTHDANDQDAIAASQQKFRDQVRDENVEGAEAADAKRSGQVLSSLEADQASFREAQQRGSKSTSQIQEEEDEKNGYAQGFKSAQAEDQSESEDEDDVEEGDFSIQGKDQGGVTKQKNTLEDGKKDREAKSPVTKDREDRASDSL